MRLLNVLLFIVCAAWVCDSVRAAEPPSEKLQKTLETKISVRFWRYYLPAVIIEINRQLPANESVNAVYGPHMENVPWEGVLYEGRDVTVREVLDQVAAALKLKWNPSGDYAFFWRTMPKDASDAALALLRRTDGDQEEKLDACLSIAYSGDIFAVRDAYLVLLAQENSEQTALLFKKLNEEAHSISYKDQFGRERYLKTWICPFRMLGDDLVPAVRDYVQRVQNHWPRVGPLVSMLELGDIAERHFTEKFKEEFSNQTWRDLYMTHSPLLNEFRFNNLSHHNPKVQSWALYQLGRSGDPRVFDELYQRATKQTPDHTAIQAMKYYDRPEADALRVQFMYSVPPKEDWGEQRKVAEEFGRQGKHLDNLAEMLNKTNPELVYRGALGLYQARDKRCLPAFMNLLKNPKWPPQKTYYSMERLPEMIALLRAAESYDTIFDFIEHGEHNRAQALANAMSSVPDPDVTRRFMDIFTRNHKFSYDKNSRSLTLGPRAAFAFIALLKSGDPEADDYLLNVYNQKNEEILDENFDILRRSYLISRFWSTRSEKGLRLLLEELKNPDVELRKECVRVLSYLNTPAAEEAIMEILRHDADPQVRAMAVGFASNRARQCSTTFREALLYALKTDPDASVRQAVASTVCYAGMFSNTRKAIVAALKNDPDSGVRRSIFGFACYYMRDYPTCIAAMRECAKNDRDLSVQCRTAEALTNDALTEENWEETARVLLAHPAPEIRARVARMGLAEDLKYAFSLQTKRKIFDMLWRTAVKDADPAVRISALYSLNEDRANPETLAGLTKWLEEEKDATVRAKIEKSIAGDSVRESDYGIFIDKVIQPAKKKARPAVKPPTAPPTEPF